jgi:hypothetical protein
VQDKIQASLLNSCRLNSVLIIQSWVRGRLRYFAAKRSGNDIIICMCAEYNEAECLKRQALLSQLFDTKELLRSGKDQGIYVCLLFVLILPNTACLATKQLLYRVWDQGTQN